MNACSCCCVLVICMARRNSHIWHGLCRMTVHAEPCAADSVMKLHLQVERDMEALANVGINSFKFFMAYKGVFQVQRLLPCLDLHYIAPGTGCQSGVLPSRCLIGSFDRWRPMALPELWCCFPAGKRRASAGGLCKVPGAGRTAPGVHSICHEKCDH
jgi:hypothetical protein